MTNSHSARVDIYAIYFDFSHAVMCDWLFYIICHNFSFRRDIICPVSCYFSLLLSTVARHCDATHLSAIDGGKNKE